MNVGKIVDSENVQLDEMVGTWSLKTLFVCFVLFDAFLWQVGSYDIIFKTLFIGKHKCYSL